MEKQLDDNEAVRERLDREIRRQSADQEELLGEQEDAVKEVLQTQSGLTEMFVVSIFCCFVSILRSVLDSVWCQKK